MKTTARVITVALGLFCAASVFAQTAVPAAAKASAPAVAAAPAAKAASAVVAPGGGEGKVWVNSKSKIYHCQGTPAYGKTKGGEYMAEADAKAKGNHASHGKACSK